MRKCGEKVIAFGVLNDQRFMVLPSHSTSLWEYQLQHPLSKFSVLGIANQLIDSIQRIHAEGFVFNDLHPENIVVDRSSQIGTETSSNVFKNVELRLINYGCVS